MEKIKKLIKYFDDFNIDIVFFVVFLLCLIHSFYCLRIGWNNALLDVHGFRQTQTAISTYYLIQGSSWLKYETPILGAPWSIPFEFPLYQWLVAIIVKTWGTPLDQTGRLVSAIFFYLSLIPSYLILGYLNVSKPYRWIFLSLFLASPLYLFWSRTFMIESTALFFSLAYLAAVCAYFRHKSLTLVIAASLLGIVGAVIKITTFVGFALAVSILTLYNWYKSQKTRTDIVYILVIPILAFALLPYLALSSWTHFADSQKLLNPIAADFITSKVLKAWNFGTLEQRLSFSLWQDKINRIFYDIWGKGKIILILLIILPIFSLRKKLYIVSLSLFFAVLLIFTNLHFIHNYYQYANGIFLIAAVGFGILGLLEKKGISKILGSAILIMLLIFQASAYQNTWANLAKQTNTTKLETGAAIQKYTNPNDVIFIYGLGWSSEIPYYSQRRTLLDKQTKMALPDNPKMKQALSQLTEYKIGAMVFCKESRGDTAKIADLTEAYHFQQDPVYANSYCQIHIPMNRD